MATMATVIVVGTIILITMGNLLLLLHTTATAMIFCIHALPSLRDRLERISPIGISFKDK
jgi:hypothetical protein